MRNSGFYDYQSLYDVMAYKNDCMDFNANVDMDTYRMGITMYNTRMRKTNASVDVVKMNYSEELEICFLFSIFYYYLESRMRVNGLSM